MGGSIGLGAAGSIVAAFGYNAAFLTLAAVAVIAVLVMVVAMPETRPTPGKLDQPLLGVVLEPEPPRRGRHSCQFSQPLCFRPGPALERAALARIDLLALRRPAGIRRNHIAGFAQSCD